MSSSTIFLLASFAAVALLVLLPLLTEAASIAAANADQKADKPDKQHKPHKQHNKDKQDKTDKHDKPDKRDNANKPDKQPKPHKPHNKDKQDKLDKPDNAGKPDKADTQHKVGNARVTKKTLKADVQRLEARLEQLSKGAGASGLTYLDGNRILVFRVTAGAGGSVYDRYKSAGVNNDLYGALTGCGCKTVNGSCNIPYRSGLLDQWPSALIDTVRVSVYKQGKEVAYVEFNGRGSDNTNWFSVDRVLSSSWTDVKTETHNFFSIEGGGWGRRFFISRNYGGCPGDRSWLVVSDQTDPCDWGKKGTVPLILYSKLQTYGNPNDAAEFDKADMLTVTIKLNASC